MPSTLTKLKVVSRMLAQGAEPPTPMVLIEDNEDARELLHEFLEPEG